ncbi:hypothetical protein VTK56DRAFT_8583 [Thermocarpiscus australiensis]
MSGEDQDDPFLWDEDRVVQELCTPNRSWRAPPGKRLPDPAALEARLRECGVDGETLLTYEDVFDFPTLWGYLEIKKLPHQLSIQEAIAQFRKRSPGYRKWKAQQLADSQTCGDEDEKSLVKSELPKPADAESAAPVEPVGGPILGNELAGQIDAEPRSAVPDPTAFCQPTVSCQGVLSPALSLSAELDLPALPEPPGVPPVEQSVTEGPPSKKRKIAPISISTEPTGTSASAFIQTEADLFLKRTAASVPQADDASGFLGTGILRLDEVTRPEPSDPSDVDNDGFSWVRKPIPRGRRIQVSSIMKRFFRSNRLGIVKPSSDPEEESVMGQSDDESVDSETWQEYLEEEEELKAMKARMDAAKERLLSRDEVSEIIRHAIRDLEAQWIAEKKPKHDRKAWRIWQDARRNPDRLAVIDSARKFSEKLDKRIASVSEHILKEKWTPENDVRHKASGFLENTVFEKKYQDWLIEVLESPRQPRKPSALPKPAPKAAKPKILENDEESLTSESDDMDGFIEYDDAVDPVVIEKMDIDSDLALGQAVAPASPGSEHSGPADEGASNNLPERTPSGEEDNALPRVQPTPKIKSEQKGLPETPRRATTSAPEAIEIESSPSPIQRLDVLPDLDSRESLERIGEIGVEYWEKTQDADRLVAAVLCGWSSTKVSNIANAINKRGHDEVWAQYIQPTIDKPKEAAIGSVELDISRLFDAFISKTARRLQRPTLRTLTAQRMKREERLFAGFCALLRRIIPHLLPTACEGPSRQPASGIHDPAEDSSDASDTSSSDDMPIPSSKKRRRRKRKRLDQQAASLRDNNAKLNEERARRARQLREKMAQSGEVPGDKSRLIVNETKESDEQALIYINDYIGSKIKDHQIEGVRFMWNQVVVDSNVRQGCLLAHTMGLGKTMQVITLLVVIAEASTSPDESVRSQIPESLRQSKTLILCPPSLVDNWLEEVAMWAPEGLLGPLHRVDAALSPRGRIETIRQWASSGGVLVIGYSMFTRLVQNDEETAKLLLETPNLVVGDEAHWMKNSTSQRHQATANFKTMNRIAMTGSPLTNNVMDYYAMINWVAPNYLADIAEFRERYAYPIKEGLYADSDDYQKRKARKLLRVLNGIVAPKIHRRDIDVLFNELPPKKEFIITLPLTKLQMRLYETYIQWTSSPSVKELMTTQARAWSLVAKLRLVLAHPFIFKTVTDAQNKEKAASSASSPQSASTPNIEEEEDIELPQDVLIKLLATVAVREIEDYALSNKILVLLRILAECRKAGDKVLIFSHSIPTLNYIENIFKRQRVVYQRLDGATPMSERQRSIKKFNTDSESEVYLISTTAGGLGLNIYGANRVVIFDFSYTPAEEQQAIGRAYRLGQTKPVFVYWLTVGGTFEDTIHNHAIFKTQLASRVVDKKNPDPWSKRFAEYFAPPRIPDQEDVSKALGHDQVLDALLKSDDVGKLVRKITSTDTFEKEEEYDLSAEDQREVDELLRLRVENPAEYRRREQERLWQARVQLGMPPQPLGVSQPVSAYVLPSPATPFPQPVVNSTVPPPPQFPAGQDSSAVGQHIPPPTQSEPDGTSAQAISQESRTAELQPILAAGTHYKTPYPPPSSAPPGALSIPGLQAPQPFAGAAPPGASSISGIQAPQPFPRTAHPAGPSIPGIQPTQPSPVAATPRTPSALGAHSTQPIPGVAGPKTEFGDLLNVHNRLREEGQHVRYHPNDVVNKLKGLLAKLEALPYMDKMQSLQKCSRNPRFAEAMLSGYVEPEQLASMTRLEMEEMSVSLNGMAEADFKRLVWTAKADLNQMRAQLSPKVKTEKRKTEARRDVAIKGTQQHIGPWPGPRVPATPQDPRRAVRPGDSADSPQVID